MTLKPSIDFNEIYSLLIYQIAQHGYETGETYEIIGTCIKIIDIANIKLTGKLQALRQVNYDFAESFAQSIIRGDSDYTSIKGLSERAKQYTEAKPPDNLPANFMMTYGERLKSQEEHLLYELNTAPETRRAIAHIWCPDDYKLIHSNEPFAGEFSCTSSIQFFIRNGYLHTHIHMRSSNAYRILPIDVYLFGRYSEYIFSKCNNAHKLGSMTMSFGSSHIFKSDMNKAMEIANAG